MAVSKLRPALQAEGAPELSSGQRVRCRASVPLRQVFQAVQTEQPPEEPSAVVRQRVAAVPVRHLQEAVHAEGQHENAPEHHSPAARRAADARRGVRVL